MMSQLATGRTLKYDGRRQPSSGDTSRINREVYVRICERLEVKFLGPTRLVSRTRWETRCCMRDEGRSLGVALWEVTSNCRKLLRTKSLVVNVSVKRRKKYVKYGLERRAQANLWLKHRKDALLTSKPGSYHVPGMSARATYLLLARCPV